MTTSVQLKDLLGVWHLRRQIADRRLDAVGSFLGTARFERDAKGALQRETGVLRFAGGPPMQADRVYRWQEAQGRFLVFFEDGRPFHDFAPYADQRATHLCGADTYRVTYDFAGWPFWTSQWTVTGPRKDLVITTEFSREGQS